MIFATTQNFASGNRSLFIHELGEYIKERIKGFEEKKRTKSLEDLQMLQMSKANA
ncbi:hypothetical protein LguiB_010918 [Lonicera macranthoides]